MIRYKYPLKVSFGYQQRNLAGNVLIKNRKALLKYVKYLSKKHKIPQSKIVYWMGTY